MAAVLERVSTPAPAAATMPGRLRGFLSGATEIDDTPMAVHGRLPGWLRGDLLLNGPALWELPQGHYEHWFDGLAMFHRIHLGDGQASYRSRFAQSEDYALSLAAGKPAFGEFDTPDPERWVDRLRHFFHPRTTDNPQVVMSRIGERWIANTETEHLTEFDPDSLATLGRLVFDDKLKMPLLAAHGMTDAQGDYWNIGVELGPKCIYRVFRIRACTQQREVLASVTVPKAGYLHAFARSRRHIVFWETAMRAQPLSFLFTRRAYIRNFRWDPGSGSALHAVSLDDGSVRRWSIPPMMCFHAVQAFEDGGDLVIDLCDYPDASIFEDLRLDALRAGATQRVSPRLSRYRLRPGQADAVPQRIGEAFELPQIHPSRIVDGPARWAWGAGFDPTDRAHFLDRTVRIDLAQGERREWQRPDAVQLEPLFVARPGAADEDDGVLLVPTLADDDPTSVIAVVDARRMECLATLEAPQVIPFGFHAAFRPA